MTHTVVYMERGCSREQLGYTIRSIKDAYHETFSLNDDATSVVIHELNPDEISDSMKCCVVLLVYTALGKGKEVKRRCVKALYQGIKETLGERAGEVQIIIKEHANDMTGENGIMRANNKTASSAYEV